MRQLGEMSEIDETFPDDHVLAASDDLIPWFADFVNYLASDIVPQDLPLQQRKTFMHDVKKFFQDGPYLYRSYVDGVIHRCVTEVEMLSVIEACHSLLVDGCNDQSLDIEETSVVDLPKVANKHTYAILTSSRLILQENLKLFICLFHGKHFELNIIGFHKSTI